ncbi:MAG: DmsC/YnfH family molybdoenzyme membrane anchor subunit [Hyphomicrobiales bacterium]|nr:dimethyl sulfoxide reductase anchor subunit [Alphaproteobacteria bacterium]
MHPAYSVIVFTTASGAGYGLLVWIAAGVAFGFAPRDAAFGFVGMGVALAMITTGLLTSTLHLGRPERAWRAFSQWRTSWLSREGVAAVVTYIPAGLLGLGLVFGEFAPGQIVLGAALSAPCALITLWCTGMIYASLPTIRAWHQPLVAPLYVVLGLATGGVLMTGLLLSFGHDAHWIAAGGGAAMLLGAILKRLYWTAIDTAKKTYTAEAATGLGHLGTVRPLDPPHTQPNFVMREIGYQVARRHAEKLRSTAAMLLFLLPLAAALLLLINPPHALQLIIAALATASMIAGVLMERWLFFAEAEHVVVVYYRGGSA